jgi:hypothetical protein
MSVCGIVNLPNLWIASGTLELRRVDLGEWSVDAFLPFRVVVGGFDHAVFQRHKETPLLLRAVRPAFIGSRPAAHER